MDLVPIAPALVTRQIAVFRPAEPRAGEARVVHVRRRGDAPADEEPDLGACFHRRRLGLRPRCRGVSAADEVCRVWVGVWVGEEGVGVVGGGGVGGCDFAAWDKYSVM